MSFLTRSPGMTKREAAQIVELHELVQHSLATGPVPLEIYVKIRRVDSVTVEHQERNARRLVALLRSLGFVVKTEGDAEKLTLDFSEDEALRAQLEREIDEAIRVSATQEEDEDENNDSRQLVREPVEQIRSDHELGLAVRHLCRRYKITEQRMLALLRVLKTEARHEGRPRLEERRSSTAVERALNLGEFKVKDGRRGSRTYGRVTTIARMLGCHRDTARAFLKRYDALGKPS